ncbi:GntR family transcriptional regulator [Pseudonocardia sp.]|jgi:DNA-binding GntR family transcriptional regulator|uniref:GntR family transcriptional regulator n=1 Tax=Pseudonocardia sp. TaxID=60912 RepID=UPI0031FCFF06
MPASTPRAGWTASLSRQRETLHAASTAARVADLLRAQVLDGELRPGVQLGEEALVEALGVSRNTIREGLQILGHERLVEHRRHRGVFVRQLSQGDLADLCGLRRSLEIGALREAAALDGPLDPELVAAVQAAAAEGVEAVAREDWAGVGTANSNFHLGLAALPGNPRIDSAIRSLLAELRLAFLLVAHAQEMHERYVPAHVELAAQIAAGRLDDAAVTLERYLRRSQRHLITAYAAAVEQLS